MRCRRSTRADLVDHDTAAAVGLDGLARVGKPVAVSDVALDHRAAGAEARDAALVVGPVHTVVVGACAAVVHQAAPALGDGGLVVEGGANIAAAEVERRGTGGEGGEGKREADGGTHRAIVRPRIRDRNGAGGPMRVPVRQWVLAPPFPRVPLLGARLSARRYSPRRGGARTRRSVASSAVGAWSPRPTIEAKAFELPIPLDPGMPFALFSVDGVARSSGRRVQPDRKATNLMKTLSLRFNLSLLVALSGCGDVSSPEYAGDPVATYRGSVTAAPGLFIPANLRTTISWVVPDGSRAPAVPPLGEVVLGQGPGVAGTFTLEVFEPPPPVALEINEANRRAGVAIGRVLAYADNNGDEQLNCPTKPFDCEDTVIGAAPNAVVLYAPTAWPADAAPVLRFGRDSPRGSGVRPAQGWQLAHVETSTNTCADPLLCEERPYVREWRSTDSIELRLAGDIRQLTRAQLRNLIPEVD